MMYIHQTKSSNTSAFVMSKFMGTKNELCPDLTEKDVQLFYAIEVTFLVSFLYV